MIRTFVGNKPCEVKGQLPSTEAATKSFPKLESIHHTRRGAGREGELRICSTSFILQHNNLLLLMTTWIWKKMGVRGLNLGIRVLILEALGKQASLTLGWMVRYNLCCHGNRNRMVRWRKQGLLSGAAPTMSSLWHSPQAKVLLLTLLPKCTLIIWKTYVFTIRKIYEDCSW